MDTYKLKSLLDEICDLEKRKYTLEKLRSAYTGELDSIGPDLVERPYKSNYILTPPKPPRPPIKPKSDLSGFLNWFLVILCAVWLVLDSAIVLNILMSGKQIYASIDLILMFIMPFAGIIFVFGWSTRSGKTERQIYREEMRAFRKNYDKLMADYQKKLAHFNSIKESEKAQFADAINKYKKQTEYNRQVFNYRMNDLCTHFAECTDKVTAKLNALYSKNVVSKKYRSLVCICSLYEYIDSGKCTHLSGFDGAYAEFDRDVRKNLVRPTIENVEFRLDSIKEHQNLLYLIIKESERINATFTEEIGENDTEVVDFITKYVKDLY